MHAALDLAVDDLVHVRDCHSQIGGFRVAPLVCGIGSAATDILHGDAECASIGWETSWRRRAGRGDSGGDCLREGKGEGTG